MSANDDFSLHDDEELSLHDDASLAGSVPASNKGDAPAKPPQIITTNTLSNIKLPVLQKDDYDTWAMEMEHYLEYIDNEVLEVADEKERKARTLLLMAVPKDHLSFEAFTISSKESLEKGYDRFQKLLSQLDALGASVSDEDANHKFLRSLPPAWDNIQKTSSSSLTSDNVAFLSQAKASSSKHKPSHNSGSYSSYTTSSSKATPTATPGLADEKRPRVDGKMHVAFDKRKVECFNCHNTGHFARECKFKGTKDGSRQEASRGQDFKPVRTEKEALMTIDEGQINWVEQTTDEEINHALMAFTVNNEVSMCSKLCLDSYNALKAKYDELQSEFGDQEAALTAHKIGLKKVEAQLRASHKQQISLNEKLHFQANQIFEKDEKLKKYRRIGMKAVKDKDALQKIVDSWFASSKNLWKLIDCGMSSNVKLFDSTITCQSNDSDGESGTVSDHSVNDDPVSTQKTQPKCLQPLRQLTLVVHSIVHVNAGTQVKSGTSRFNTGKQHVNSGSVYVNSVTQIKSAASRVNTGKRYINSGCVHINTARVNRPMSNKPNPKPSQGGKMGTAVKTSAGCVWRKTSPLSITNSGPIPDSYVHVYQGPQGRPKPMKAWVPRVTNLFLSCEGSSIKHMEHRGIFDSGCSGHMTGNRAHLEDYQETSKVGSVTFGGSNWGVSVAADSENNVTKKRHSSKKPSLSPLSTNLMMTLWFFRNELDALALKHLGPVPTTVPTSTNPVNTGSSNLNTAFEEVNTGNMEAVSPSAQNEEEVFSDDNEDEMPEIRFMINPSEGIFEHAFMMMMGFITDFNNLPDEVDVITNPTLRIHNVHPQSQILGDPNTPVQTRSSLKKITEAHALVSYIQAHQRSNHKDQQHCLFACFLSQFEPRKVTEALEDGSWMPEIRIYDKSSEGIFEKDSYDDEGIISDFNNLPDEHELKLSEKHGYKRGTIDKTLFIRRNKKDIMLVQVYVDDIIFGSTNKSWCDEFEALMQSRFQMSSMGELTFFLGLQVKQNKEGIFISQDKYVAEILKKFDLVNVKAAITPMETDKCLITHIFYL
ncbi:putative ribonuclease H-like domain-containing protein [Tanacetum coccineum]